MKPDFARMGAGLALLAAALGLPRALALERPVTPDEVNWLTGSSAFYRALARGDWASTYQLEHPGVTTLWAGTAGFVLRDPAYASEVGEQVNWWEGEVGPVLRARGRQPLDVLTAGRAFVLLAITLVLLAAFVPAASLFGYWPALMGFLLIAVDPFHIAHSRLLHLDGLLSSLMFLSVLALARFLLQGGSRVSVVVSGAAAGLAWLTKSPTLFLMPFAGLLVVLPLGVRCCRERVWPGWRLPTATLLLWGAAGLVTFVVLWPAMWVDPLWTVWRVLRASVSYAVGGHEAPLFFNGQVVDGDPGLLFYPITYLWRTTPVVLLGLALAGAALIKRPALATGEGGRRALALLLMYVALFSVFINLGSKKFDRYLLPVYLPLDLLAGIGWVAAARWLGRSLPARLARRAVHTSLAAAAVAAQAMTAASAFPYYLAYYNPLLGGTRQAPRVMMVGWGEGLDQAAEYLNTHAGAAPTQAVVGVWTGTFSYYFQGQTLWSDFAPGEDTAETWRSADYCVIYINQWQRHRLPQALLDYLDELAPMQVVRIHGLDYAYIYDIRAVPPPAYLFAAEPAHMGQKPGLR